MHNLKALLIVTMDDVDATTHCRENNHSIFVHDKEYIVEPCENCRTAYHTMNEVNNRF